MERMIEIKEDYLYLPICAEQDKQLLEIFHAGGEKLFEFQIPVGKAENGCYPANYYARFPVKKFTDKTLILKGELPEAFFDAIENAPARACGRSFRHPSIHFTAETGWINDPNGLVYKDGVYHLYFQYNPFDTQWENMSWGHAVSTDLLHWEQRDSVLFPDASGTMFSGCGMVNEHGKLGLPQDALVFFYTAAGNANRWSEGKDFTQRVAYSVDGGETLVKMEKGVVSTVCKENRDPKVFWHEESNAYIMLLWLEENDFGIFRSGDLEKWEQSDRFTLERGFECPDLVKLYDEQGKAYWMFWCADGFYYWGDFDGYRFMTDGIRHEAYMNKVPYAAQTFSGVEDRVIQIPWLRIGYAGRLYTGAMGMPRELGVTTRNGKPILSLKPVKEFETWYQENGKAQELVKRLDVTCDVEEKEYHWTIGGFEVSYRMQDGLFTVGEEQCVLRSGIKDFSFIVDDDILEVAADCDTIIGVYAKE